MKLAKEHYAIIALTTVGAIIRLYHLGWNSLWLDEAATLWYSSSGYKGAWIHTLTAEYNPPLFYWITAFMLNFGKSEFILRLVPAIAGIATVPLVYFLGKEWRNSTIGLAAAALVAFSPMLVYYSQEARTYTLTVVLCLLFLYSYLKAEKTHTYKWWFVTAVFASLAFWSHFYTFLLISAVFLYSIWNSKFVKERIKYPLVASVVFTWATLPIILATYNLLKLRTRGPPMFGIQGWQMFTDIFWNFGDFSIGISVLFFLLFLYGLWILYKKEPSKSIFIGFLFIFIIGITIPFSYFIPMVSRYVLFMLPLFLIVISEPLTVFKEKQLSALAVCAMIALGTSPIYQMHTTYTKVDWRGFATNLTEYTKDGDSIITCPSYMDLPLLYYYNNSTDNTTVIHGSNITELMRHTRENKTWYVVTPDTNVVLEAKNIPEYLNENATLILQTNDCISLYFK